MSSQVHFLSQYSFFFCLNLERFNLAMMLRLMPKPNLEKVPHKIFLQTWHNMLLLVNLTNYRNNSIVNQFLQWMIFYFAGFSFVSCDGLWPDLVRQPCQAGFYWYFFILYFEMYVKLVIASRFKICLYCSKCTDLPTMFVIYSFVYWKYHQILTNIMITKLF